MSDIRYNQWLHNSGTGGVSQDAGGNVGIGTTNPLIPVGAGNTAILNVGVVSATTYYGNANNLSFTNLTAATGTFTGDVSIGGTLTYQDVTNIDSVGLVTARDGVNVSGGDFKVGTGATIYSDGNAFVGILTANQVFIPNNQQLRIGNGNVFKFWHDGSNSFVENTTGNIYIQNDSSSSSEEILIRPKAGEDGIKLVANAQVELYHDSNLRFYTTSSSVNVHTGIDLVIPDKIVHEGDTNTKIRFPANDAFSVETAGSERLRIDSSGNIGAGTASPSSFSATDLVISKSASAGITISVGNAGTTNTASIFFAEGSGGTGDKERGAIKYKHGDDYLAFHTNASERLRIQSNGKVLINTTTPGATGANDLTLATTGSTGLTIRSGTSNDGNIFFSDATSGSAEYAGYIQYEHANNVLRFGTAEAERFRINSSGALGLGGATYGSSGQVLTSAGSGGVPTWTTVSAGPGTGESYVKSRNGSGNLSNSGTNTYAGYRAGSALASGCDHNTLYGSDAGRNIASGGGYHTAIGERALEANSSGNSCVAVGQVALMQNTGNQNVAVGNNAIYGSGAGSSNTAVGYMAMNTLTSGANNTSVGHHAGRNYTTCGGNVSIGKDAHDSNQTGGENTIVGHQAAQANTSNRNTCLGNSALYSNITGYNNVAIGRYAMMLAGGGTNINACTAIGHNAMYNGGGDGNTCVGSEAGQALTTGHSNTVLGASAFDANQAGHYTVAIGNNCLGNFNSAQAENTAIGSQCATALTNGVENIFIGRECATGITGGSYNVILGKSAMAGSTGSNVHSNVVIGRLAGRLITSSNNIVLGREAAYDMTSGNENIIMGHEAAYNLTTGGHNIIMGYQAAKNNIITSSSNVIIGSDACKDMHAQTSSIVAIGRYALDAYDGYGGGSFGGWTVAVGTGAMGANRNTRHSVCIGNSAGNVWNPTEGNLHEGGCVFVGGTAGSDGPTTATAAVAIGRNAYASGNNKTGANNVAIGTRALEQCVGGQHNVCMGTFAGYRITSGNNNVMIGYLSGYGYDTTNATQDGAQNVFIGGFAHSSGAGTDYENVIGYDGTGKGSNTTFIRGSSGCYQQNNSSSWSTTSDIRIKKNVVDNNVGLDAIEKVRVRNFEYRTVGEITDFDNPEAVVCDEPGTQLGVIAQEIQEILPDVVEQQTTGAYTVNPDNMTWYLVNAVKELSAEVKALKAQLNS